VEWLGLKEGVDFSGLLGESVSQGSSEQVLMKRTNTLQLMSELGYPLKC
jgi:hypothetical protein